MRSSGWSRWLGNGLALAGLAVLLAPVVSSARTRHRQAQLEATVPDPPTVTLSAGGFDWSHIPPPADAPVWPNTRLVIPALGLRFVVQEGDDLDRLRDGPVHVPGTGAPGCQDRVVIAGHNNIHGSPFKDLDQLREGDLLYLANGQGVWEYRVATTAVLQPTDVDRIIDDTRRGLTLLTCYPYVHATQRLVVLASLVGPVAALP